MKDRTIRKKDYRFPFSLPFLNKNIRIRFDSIFLPLRSAVQIRSSLRLDHVAFVNVGGSRRVTNRDGRRVVGVE